MQYSNSNPKERLLLLALVILIAALAPELAHAAGEDGSTLVQRLKDFFYGPWGLAIGFVGVVWGVIRWLDNGFKEAIPVFGAVMVFYFVPFLVTAFQGLAKSS